MHNLQESNRVKYWVLLLHLCCENMQIYHVKQEKNTYQNNGQSKTVKTCRSIMLNRKKTSKQWAELNSGVESSQQEGSVMPVCPSMQAQLVAPPAAPAG